MTERISREAQRPKPRIGITIGDPAGIGPEVSLEAVCSEEVLAACVPVIIGDAQYLSHWAAVFGVQHDFRSINAGEPLPDLLERPNSF